MYLTVECPDELFGEVDVASAMTGVGARLEAVEEVPTGPWLAAFLAGVDLGRLTEWDLPAYLRAAARLQAWSASLVGEGVAEMASRPGGHGADKEVALALREPVGAAKRRIWRAGRLRRLPTVRRLSGHGALSEQQVVALVEATGRVRDPELLAAVEDRVLNAPRGLARTGRELARAARQALTRLDPAGAQDRAREAREDADVSHYPGEDGMAATLIDGPVEQSLIVKTAADTYAATRKAAGDPRRVGVLRSEGIARICGDYLTGASTLGTARPRSGGLPIEIGIVIDLDTALGRRDLPGEVPGHGIVPREVIARMVAEEGAKLRLLVIDDTTGRLLHRAADAYRPTPEQIAHVRAEYVYSAGPGSQVPAVRTDTDHADPYPHGETVIGNLIPNDRTWHNGHTHMELSVKVDDTGAITWTSVLGQSRTVEPYDYRLQLLAEERGEAAPDEPPIEDPPPF